jgi:hypothetical protein
MTKKELIKKLEAREVKCFKSWNKTKLQEKINETAEKMAVFTDNDIMHPTGNWNTAKDWFPTIDVDQETRTVEITTFESASYEKKATVETEWMTTSLSESGDSLYIRGEVYVKNWSNYKCSGSQKFCFAVFVGDSGHIYTHRASATKGWMNGNPEGIRKRLRKLGIGATEDLVQQGDFLLKPANGRTLEDTEFKHETTGAGHHNFEMPVLYAFDGKSRQYKITEPTKLVHTAIDGIQHPTVTVPVGIWIVGTTASQLHHSNARD